MKRTSSCLAILLLAVVLADGRTLEMTLHPAKAPEPAQKYLFLPKAEEQTDTDAMPQGIVKNWVIQKPRL